MRNWGIKQGRAGTDDESSKKEGFLYGKVFFLLKSPLMGDPIPHRVIIGFPTLLMGKAD